MLGQKLQQLLGCRVDDLAIGEDDVDAFVPTGLRIGEGGDGEGHVGGTGHASTA